MIIRYTTPYHNFVLPFLAEEIEVVELIYSQNGEVVLDKKSNDAESKITITDLDDIIKNASMGYEEIINEITGQVDDLESCSLLRIHLTQDDTALFKRYKAERKNIALIEIRVKDKKEDSFICFPIQVRIFGGTQQGVL